MQVYSRFDLVSSVQPCGEPALLLEGDWPDGLIGNHWSLDSQIDARHEWIDCEATRIAAALAGETWDSRNPVANRRGSGVDFGQSALPIARSLAVIDSRPLLCGLRLFAYLNARDLRYYLVKLLRVTAFFERAWRGPLPARICLYVARGRDGDYALLFERLASRLGILLDMQWCEAAPPPAVQLPPNRLWRRFAGVLTRRCDQGSGIRGQGSGKTGRAAAGVLLAPGPWPLAPILPPRVILCGNRRFLDPICNELLRREARVWWLYDRFAAGAWWRWRGYGVGQLVCDSSLGKLNRFATVDERLPDDADEMLAPAIADWLRRRSQTYGARQTRLLEQIRAYFDQVRPTLLILDEDATPLPRVAIAVARSRGAASIVVQHGAPCVRFGFAPLAADRICVWGESSRRQLLRWGVEESQIVVTGPVGLGTCPRNEVSPCSAIQPRNILLLATTPARDERPDAVGFHLTRRTYAQMLRMACACVSRVPGARLTIKLHPRTCDATIFTDLLRQFPTLRANIVRGGRLDRFVSRADCVLSCASSSGVEAVAAGVPVIQLLPLGSGDILPPAEWGFLGLARTEAELEEHLKIALAGGSNGVHPCAVTSLGATFVFHDPAGAAQRIVDAALISSRTDVAEPAA